ncbi:MAG: WD40/YVTN/BNR-like repeat-containing protein, partial [Flavisolibacter sp.]
MRKFYLLLLPALLCLGVFLHYHSKHNPNVVLASTEAESEDEEEGYDGPWERDSLEFEKTKDPFLGYVPVERLGEAMDYTEDLKATERRARMAAPLSWNERGPIYDSLGPSNGNSRAGVNYTSGRITAVLLDTLNDPTGNTVFAGGIAGGLWKCTNMLEAIPNWKPVNDYFANMAVSSICQDPSNPAVMYFATGEATSNADAVYGKGVWKSVDAGKTWKQLPSTSQYLRNFKIMCDNAGNVYLATRSLTGP